MATTQNPNLSDTTLHGARKDSEKESMTKKAGDKLERAGEKIKNAGAEKIGNAIYKAGNKLEHHDDKKKSH